MTRADLRFIEVTPVIRAHSQPATARTEACLGGQRAYYDSVRPRLAQA
jgi:hypothetical protein